MQRLDEIPCSPDFSTLDPDGPPRPALRYFGGKWVLAPWIVSNFPQHRVYVEPFGGGASVLLRKRRAYAEVYNDLDREVFSFFDVLRDPARAARLIELLRLTPFHRDEFVGAYEPTDDPIEAARRLVARSFMGHGSNAVDDRRSTGFRIDSNNSGTSPARDWGNFPDCLARVAERLIGVGFENRPALSLIERFDKPHALLYVDPPYLHSVRSKKQTRDGAPLHGYRHEMSDADHLELVEALLRSRAMVVLSGYPNPIYDEALTGWTRISAAAHADNALDRTEALWINPAAERARSRPRQEAML